MAAARYKDLVCICVDVGGPAGSSAPDWADVLQRVIASRCINDKAHLEVAIIVYGSDATQNYLDSDSTYAGIDVICEFMPADVKTLALLPRRVVAGTTHVPDFFSALAVAADLLKRTAEDRKLTAARKHIVLASPFTAAIEPVEDSVLGQLFGSLSEIGAPAISAAVSGWLPPKGPQEAAALAAARRAFAALRRAGAYGAVEVHASPRDVFSVVRAHSAPTMTQNVLKIDEFEVAIKTAKLTEEMKLAAFKPAAADVPAGESPFLMPSTRYHLKGQPDEERTAEDKQQVFRFGDEHFPALPADEYNFQPASPDEGFKGIQVVSFVHDSISPRPPDADDADDDDEEPEAAVPRWAIQDTLVAVMPATDLAAAAVSALVRALRARRRMALVRFALQANSAVALGALVPVLGFRDDYPDHFVLCRAPWANDYRRLQLPPLEKVAEAISLQTAEMDAIAEFVHARTDPAPASAAAYSLPSDRRCDPVRSALAMAVAREATGAAADGDGAVDPFVAEVLLPSPQGGAAAEAAAAAVLRMLPELQDPTGVGIGVTAAKADEGSAAVKEEPVVVE